MMKVHFSESERAKQVERELIEIIGKLNELSSTIVKTAYKVPYEDTRGCLIGYADMVNNIGGNICDLFEFYK